MSPKTPDQALTLDDISDALLAPSTQGDTPSRRQLRAVLEAGGELDLSTVDEGELHDADAAFFARIAYVSSYIRLFDFLRQPAESFGQKKALAAVGLSYIKNVEAQGLEVLQMGSGRAGESELKEQISIYRSRVRALAERFVRMEDRDAQQEAADSETATADSSAEAAEHPPET